jgi:hypothetical protein
MGFSDWGEGFENFFRNSSVTITGSGGFVDFGLQQDRSETAASARVAGQHQND